MIDILEIVATAGDGGSGAISFRREKNIPRGGPDGGDGGRGGSIFLKASAQEATLRAFRYKREFKAKPGDAGSSNNKFGKSGEDVTIEVPLGTVIWRHTDARELQKYGELLKEGETLRIARGGKGGRGNATYATPTQQVPYIAERGEPGEKAKYKLELKLLADVGIIGRPNAGKSTLLAAATKAQPKIAPYPFTTLEPMLGVVTVGDTNFVLAEIPGLIKGAHAGVGLGHEFLRHATRTRLLLHLVDGSLEDIAEAVREINSELREYGAGLQEKPQIFVVNKVDMPEVDGSRKEIREALRKFGSQLYFISAAGNVGVKQLMEVVAQRVVEARAEEAEREKEAVAEPIAVVAEEPPPKPKAHKEGDVYIVDEPRAIRLILGSDLRHWAGRVQAKVQLDRLGVSRALEELGIDIGDRVRFGGVELEW
ncbi:MAG: GTPase ObgE [Chloroflexi bacterium]|nr:GTPase ObgE [Chloroflexota bacterium]